MSNLIPLEMSYEQLAALLEDMAHRARVGDSYEGHIEYLMPEEDGGPDKVLVRGAYRIGNTEGQGGMRLIGTVPGIEPAK